MDEKTFYDTHGKIIYSFNSAGMEIDASAYDQYSSIEAVGDPRKQYVLEDQLAERLPNPAEIVGNLLTGVPVAGTLIIEGVSYPIAAGNTELDFSPGMNRFLLQCFPYLDRQYEVVV
jgi:hypothetical protein